MKIKNNLTLNHYICFVKNFQYLETINRYIKTNNTNISPYTLLVGPTMTQGKIYGRIEFEKVDSKIFK